MQLLDDRWVLSLLQNDWDSDVEEKLLPKWYLNYIRMVRIFELSFVGVRLCDSQVRYSGVVLDLGLSCLIFVSNLLLFRISC